MDDLQRPPALVHARVRVVQPAAHADADLQRDGLGEERELERVGPAEHPAERLTVHVLHGEEVVAVDLSEVEDLGDVPVAERHGDAGLVDEHPDEGVAPGERREDLLDHHRLAHARHRVEPRAVELGHPADGESLEQLVLAELDQDGGRHAWGERLAPGCASGA